MNRSDQKSQHELFMRRAVRLAQRATRLVTPNPRVGAVVVKNGAIIGSGYHKKAGSDHAEISALKQAGAAAKGATLYVTLEPCSTYGKTPPCTAAVIQSGIKEVVIGSVDPNPAHNGRGIALLREHGITVTTGVLKDQCDELIEDFSVFIRTGMPFVTVKLAITADGKMATTRGESQWITSEASRAKVQQIRKNVDAIMVGVTTIIADNPHLTLRVPGVQPWRIIIDPHCAIPEQATVLTDQFAHRTVLLVRSECEKTRSIAARGVTILPVESENHIFIPQTVLKSIAKLPVVSVLLEGGAVTSGHFFDHQCIDKVYMFIAPKLFGGKTAPVPFAGSGIGPIADAVELNKIQWKRYGTDMMLCGYPVWKHEK